MNYWTRVYFASSIVIPALLAIVRFRKINSAWLPFMLALWIGTINEVISVYCAIKFRNTSITNNIYVLIESLLFVWQFHNWSTHPKKPAGHLGIMFFLLSVWVLDSLVFGKLNIGAIIFRIIYSITLVLLAVNSFNIQVSSNRGQLLKNPVFIVSTGFIIFYTYRAIVGSFSVYAFSSKFVYDLFVIMVYVNCFTNLIYAYAVLCMDKKHPSSLR